MITELGPELSGNKRLVHQKEALGRTRWGASEVDTTAIEQVKTGSELEPGPETRTVLDFNTTAVRSHRIENLIWAVLMATCFILVGWSFLWAAGK